ncbi:hypothetical protein PGT21_008677 [Puccinia graminis f. sp. tritici]|uniref:Uncharacterized protein n=1 Tax=Puccinia graminis f. sp. tritici TaxID=56615 RepID=A0A5B0Q5J9_PUCGR|nr:hypothetical protein PGT21_008677 [Puccinia graminis f. sp. tritici]
MDPHLQNAHSRIRVFLADLNLVLGSTSYATPYEPAPHFNQIGFPQNFALRGPHQQLSTKRPTHRSRAWKKNHARMDYQRSEQVLHALPILPVKQTIGSTPKEYKVRFPHSRWPAHISNHRERYRPRKDSEIASQIRTVHQHNSLHYPTDVAVDQQCFEESLHQHFSVDYLDREEEMVANYPSDTVDNMIEDQGINFCSDNSIVETCELDELQLDEIEWDDRSDLDINAAPDYFQPQLLTSQTIPKDSVDHNFPETNSTQQSEPDFDLKKYSAKDVDNWASTLSADEFEHLRVTGPDARTESFRQYVITNLDQSTQTLNQQSSSNHEHLEPPVSMPNGCHDNSKYHHHQPDDISSNNLEQQQLASPDDESRSSFCNHSDDCNPHLEACDNGGFEDDDFDNGSFDGGGFDDGGFDNGGFDDGGFDDGGFDDGGFDDGGFEDGGFDGGFDDGYGSPYY